MPVKFFTATKGGKSEQIHESEVADRKANGWVLSGDERITTETGERTVNAEEAQSRLASGEATGFVSEDQLIQRAGDKFAEETYGDEGIQTFGENALATMTGGLIDPGDISAWAEGDAGATAARASTNKFEAGLGAAAGAIVGAVAPGGLGKILPGGIGARIATRVGKGVKASSGSRVAGLAAEGAVDGAFFGAIQARANAVIHDTPVNVENIIGSMTSEALYGGAFGGAIGAAVGGLGKLSRRLEAGKKATKAAAGSADDLVKLRTSLDEAKDLVTKSTTVASRAKAAKRVTEAETRLARSIAASPAGVAERVTRYANESPATEGIMSLKPEQFNSRLQKLATQELSASPAVAQEAMESLAKLDLPKQSAEQFTELAQSMGITLPATPRAQALAKAYVAKQAAQEIEQAAVKGAGKAVEKQTSKSSGLLGGIAGDKLGGMYKAVIAGPKLVKAAVTKLIKVGGKPRRGTVPAASAILGKVRFDPELGEKPVAAGTKGARRKNLVRITAELDSIAQNPEKAKTRISESLGEMQAVKPSMAAALADKAFQRMMLLHGLLPRNPNVSSLGPSRWNASNTEIDKFARIVAAAEDPYSILDDLEGGKLTQEAVDTVKQLYPEIYHNIQMELIERADEIRESVGYVGRLQLGILFQAPTDEVLQPEFVMAMQQNYAIRAQEQEQASGGGGFSTPGAAQKSIDSTQTATQRIGN